MFKGVEQFREFIMEFAEDFMPGPEREIPRDLFFLLASTWATRTNVNIGKPDELLTHVREQAWLGYWNMPSLIEAIGSEMVASTGVASMQRYFQEIADKQSTHLFLPIVSRIERHQVHCPVPIILQLDALQDEFGHVRLAGIARMAFALAPSNTRERDAFLIALMGATWGKGDRALDKALLAEVTQQLRLLYERSSRALDSLKESVVTHPAAARVIEMAEEVSKLDPSLWLETLFITESWRVGPKTFQHCAEVKRLAS